MKNEHFVKKITDPIIIIALFIISRVIYWIVGVRFDSSTLNWFFQYLDPQQLLHNLLPSIYYLHIQPPLFNLLLGIVLKISRGPGPIIFSIIFMLCGLTLAIILFKLLCSFKIPRIFSFIITGFFILSPPVILYENWLFYTYPVTTLLIISIYLINNYLEKGKTLHLFLAINTWTSIVLIRTAFHPLWLVFCIAGVILIRKKDIKRILLCSVFPVLIIVILMLKNGLVFGMFGLNSWYGMNLYKMTLSIPPNKIASLIEENKISGLALIPPFQSPEQYRQFANFDTVTGINVLDHKYKSTSYPNYNHIGYISISKQYFKIARTLIIKYPQYYLLSVGKALYRFLMPTSDKIIFPGQNRQEILGWVNIYEQYLLGNILSNFWQTNFVNRFGQTRKVHFNLLYLYLAFVYLGMTWFLTKGVRDSDLDNNNKILLYFIGFQVLYVTSVCYLVEV